MEFSTQLRRLRKEARLSQRALAEQIGVDFTYLSKIENGRVEPPSEEVLKNIARILAKELIQDVTTLADYLITLAGKIPKDLAETLVRHPEMVIFLRSMNQDLSSREEMVTFLRSMNRDVSSQEKWQDYLTSLTPKSEDH